MATVFWWVLGGLALTLALVGVLIRVTTFHPRAVQAEPVHCSDTAPELKSGQPIKVLSYNVQFMAGKNYVFFFDLPDFSGPDLRPSPQDITSTLLEVARVIWDEDPDFVLLQEVDDGARRTDYEDQLARLIALLPPDYACHTSTFYWKAAFVPHPKIWGAVALKMAILSKYRARCATRYALPALRINLLVDPFTAGRAILEARFPVKGGRDLLVMNTHLDAFVVGTNVIENQVAQLDVHLNSLDQEACAWVMGGDLNLLPAGQYERLPANQRSYYNPRTEMQIIYDRYQVIPSSEQLTGTDSAQWYTYFANDPRITQPDRTLDYLVYSRDLRLLDARVRQVDTTAISDHFPVIGKFALPAGG